MIVVINDPETPDETWDNVDKFRIEDGGTLLLSNKYGAFVLYAPGRWEKAVTRKEEEDE